MIFFHGAKTRIDGKVDSSRSRINNDFGKGFYCCESLEQSAMFVSNFPDSSLYVVDFNKEGLKSKSFGVNREWMMTIAYYRGRLDEYKDSKKIAGLISRSNNVDYITAPIADNRMFEIIDSFIEGEITDVQCQHCLSATNLGRQYVLVSQKAADHVNILEHCFLAEEEKDFYLTSRQKSAEMNRDKVKIARKQYRDQGKYIEEILNEKR